MTIRKVKIKREKRKEEKLELKQFQNKKQNILAISRIVVVVVFCAFV